MALTLGQYARYLDTRDDLAWPAPPTVKRPKAKPYLIPLPGVRAVTWSVYGTLLAVGGGELALEHPQEFILNIALDKTIQEFKMWQSMTRKPGQPAEYLLPLYRDAVAAEGTFPGGAEKYPEVSVDRVWERLIKKLLQKGYQFDSGFYGSLNEFSRKVAYFFHASLQGTECYPEAADALRALARKGLRQGILADGQCFTEIQLQRGLAEQDPSADLDKWVDPALRFLSVEYRARMPSERLLRPALARLGERGITADQVLHVGSRLTREVVPARRLGMRTALFAGDKAALEAETRQRLNSPTRPDVLLTELSQIADVVPNL